MKVIVIVMVVEVVIMVVLVVMMEIVVMVIMEVVVGMVVMEVGGSGCGGDKGSHSYEVIVLDRHDG